MKKKPKRAIGIKRGLMYSFLNKLHENHTDKAYWDECKTSRNTFTSSDIEEMKKRCK